MGSVLGHERLSQEDRVCLRATGSRYAIGPLIPQTEYCLYLQHNCFPTITLEGGGI